jgi:hypothetical protein
MDTVLRINKLQTVLEIKNPEKKSGFSLYIYQFFISKKVLIVDRVMAFYPPFDNRKSPYFQTVCR